MPYYKPLIASNYTIFAICASETARFFCTRISSAAGVAGELYTAKKESDMSKRNTNPGGGKANGEMRIHVGTILVAAHFKITVRTKSYELPSADVLRIHIGTNLGTIR